MSLMNFSSASFLTPPNYYPHHQPVAAPQPPPQPPSPTIVSATPYTYPTPKQPFLHEDYAHQQHNRQSSHHTQFNPEDIYTRINGGSGDDNDNIDRIKTKIHAVIDYDEDDNNDEFNKNNDNIDYKNNYNNDNSDNYNIRKGNQILPVTPIQGPIFLKNGSVPVVPLYSYPILNNGTFVQIPILWTALSVALGVELKGEYIKGVPCIKRNQQLFCPRAGNSYPLDRIELFIDENKALIKRMYGDFSMFPSDKRKKRHQSNMNFDPGPINDENIFIERKSRNVKQNNQNRENEKVDVCESNVEIITPYWASNSAGKIRAIVNTQHFEQAIHQEVCSKQQTKRCSNDCGCEQKYKWHRLLAYDPDNDCKGIFMDWFLFPSCCVCRCNVN